jgi:hypothetical protein
MIRAPGSRLALRPEQKYADFQRFTVPESQLEPGCGISMGSVGRPAVDCAKPATEEGNLQGL